MRTCSVELDAALSREDLTLCRLWEITFIDGRVFYYTDLSLPHLYADKVYLSDPGITVSTIRNSVTGGLQNATVELGYSDLAISERDVKLGAADGAQYRILIVDYTLPAAGHMEVFSGRVVSINVTDRISCRMELQGASAGNVGKVIGEVYSQRCRNVFGDNRCKIDINAMAVDFTVLQLIDLVRFRTRRLDDEREPPEQPTLDLIEVYEPGDYEFVVPDCDIITFEASSAGGGGNTALRGIMTYFLGEPSFEVAPDLFRNAEPGGDAVFGPYRVPGGDPGTIGSRIEADGEGLQFRGFRIARIPEDRQPHPLDNFVEPNIPTEKFPGGGGARGDSFPIQGSLYGGRGAAGGKIRGSIIVGEPGGIQVGDVIFYTVPAGGYGGGYYDNGFPNVGGQYGKRGGNGGIKFSYTANVSPPDEEYNLGSILWVEGGNTGQVDTVAYNQGGEIAVTAEPLQPIKVGDRGRFRPGCSNYADMCEERWNNLINMRAEPVVPQGSATSAPTPEVEPKLDSTKPPGVQQAEYYDPTNNALPLG